MALLEIASILVAGFSVVSAVMLIFAYAFLMRFPNKTWYSLASGALLMAALANIQCVHLLYFLQGSEPLANPYYRFWLFVVPSMFFYFGRSIIMPKEPFRPLMLIHLLPIPVLYAIRLEIALPILFMFGTGYSLWLGNLVYGLREQRKQFRFEFFYFAVLSAIAVFVLVLGFSIPYIDDAYFYHFYNNAIGLAFIIIVAALITIPNLIGDISEAARIKYSASTLGDVDVDACLKKLDVLMKSARVYENENLTLSSLADELGISSHQLSELVNTRLGTGFSRYIRQQRVEAAKERLLAAPEQSVLSIGIETGFRSQSNFYTAFKEITGQSPGDYRKANSRG